jgi:hypothetical protein
MSRGFWREEPPECSTPSCCGLCTGGYTGNTNCDPEGRINLADITRLIDRVYISQDPLCCEPNGDTNCDCKINLADITKMIDYVYVTHTNWPCQCSDQRHCWCP